MHSGAKGTYDFKIPSLAEHSMFREITDSLGMQYTHQEKDYIDFNIQKLLPHKLSDYGPALAVGDIDGNGWKTWLWAVLQSQCAYFPSADGW
jgi:hypothetical protein